MGWYYVNPRFFRGQKRVAGPPELELQAVVQEQHLPLTTKHIPQAHFLDG